VKPEGKKPLWRPRCRWKDKIKIDLQGLECGGKDFIEVPQDRERWQALVNGVINFRIP
jgi:hypothetical protein